jgi:hypothetical protein
MALSGREYTTRTTDAPHPSWQSEGEKRGRTHRASAHGFRPLCFIRFTISNSHPSSPGDGLRRINRRPTTDDQTIGESSEHRRYLLSRNSLGLFPLCLPFSILCRLSSVLVSHEGAERRAGAGAERRTRGAPPLPSRGAGETGEHRNT